MEQLKEEIFHQGSDFTKLQTTQATIDQSSEQLEEKYARWEYLSEFS
ncbi:ABC transporter C-terminal domain-containing protein [Enterococcus italicus]